MQLNVKAISVKRFHSIPAQRVDLVNPTFLVGWNGSGKSNFSDAVCVLADAMQFPLQTIFDRRGGAFAVLYREPSDRPTLAPGPSLRKPVDNILGLSILIGGIRTAPSLGDIKEAIYGFEIKVIGRYEFEVVRERCHIWFEDGSEQWYDRREGDLDTNIPWMRGVQGQWAAKNALMIPVVGGIVPFSHVQYQIRSMKVYSIEPSKLREMQDPDVGSSLRSDGSNATSVLTELARHKPESVDRICEILAAISPGTKQVRTTKVGRQLTLRFVQEWGAKRKLIFDAFNMSDGTLRALGLLLALFQDPPPYLTVIEEPESTIHPGALGAILDVLNSSKIRTQLIVTTHSPEVLDAKWIRSENIRIVHCDQGATRISEMSDMSRLALKEHLMGAGELLRANALEPADIFDLGKRPQLSLFGDSHDQVDS
jgi:predicted ATPase